MKIQTFLFLILGPLFSYAGGALVCDDYGHMCIIPGNYNCDLIPPIHTCSQKAQATAIKPDVSCGEFRYMNSLRVNLYLNDMSYEVLKTLTGAQNKLIKQGKISPALVQEGNYVIYRLLENSREIGVLKAIDQNIQPRQSYLQLGINSPETTLLCEVRKSGFNGM